MDFNLDSYLRRIGLDTAPSADAAGLAKLVEAQARAIAFENFDVWLGRPLSVEPEAIVAKLVGHRRGGYCFELNGLLGMALDTLGFNACPLLARVLNHHKPGEPPRARTHQVMLVTLDDARWIADAGFGGGLPCRPLPLMTDTEHGQLGERLRYRQDPALGWVLQLADSSGWRDLYGFSLERAYPADIVCANHYTATFPCSSFVTSVFASRPDGEGRMVLRGREVILHRGGQTRTERAPEGPARIGWLRTRFGIELDIAPDELPPF
ncbi:MAG: arylamine N-acetyltransferase family protein [Stenotrophobium sp.]